MAEGTRPTGARRTIGRLARRRAPEAPPPRFARLVWRRFRRHPLGVAGAIALFLVIILALIGPVLSPVTPLVTDFYQRGLEPTTSVGADFFQRNHPPQLWPLDRRLLLGTDSLGVPVLAYTLVGFRPALEIGLLGSLLASLAGIVIGGIAAYAGRLADVALMRLTDAFLAVPMLALIMLIVASLPERTVSTYVILFAATGWPGVARLARGGVLSLRARDFTIAAHAQGVSDLRILFRHILPNTASVLIVAFTLNAALFIVIEASLDFLNAGPSFVTWGGALASAYYSLGIISGYWWQMFFPAAALLLTDLSLNFIGDGLSDALDVTRWTVTVGAPAEEEERLEDEPVRPWDLLLAERRPSPLRFQVPGVASRAVLSCLRLAPLVRIAHALDAAHARLGALPAPLAAVPPLLLVLTIETIVLVDHSPLAYAPNFSSPTRFGDASALDGYAALPRAAGGWDLLVADPHDRIVLKRFDASGRVLRREVVGMGASGTADPSLVRVGGRLLGVWVTPDGENTQLRADYVGDAQPRSFPLTSGAGVVEHPDAVALPDGDVAVLFQRETADQSSVDLTWIRRGARRGVTHSLVPPPAEAVYPGAAADGHGALEVLYLERCCGESAWRVVTVRVGPTGRVLGTPRGLDVVHYAPENHLGKMEYNAIPPRWGLDLKTAPDGRVWAAWSGDEALNVLRFGLNGRPGVAQTVAGGGTLELALALMRHGAEIFTASHGIQGSQIAAIHVAANGSSAGVGQRVSFDPYDAPANPQAGSVHGRPQLIWQNIQSETAAFMEGVVYHTARPPDLATRLGLNIGNVWANAAFVILGSLAGGIVLAAGNVALLCLLVLPWVPIRHLVPHPARWPTYLLAVGVLLVLVFVLNQGAPPWVLLMSGLIAPLDAASRWLAVTGATVAASWVSITLLRGQEPLLRAAVTVVIAVWFVAILYAALAIQFQITQL